jgi:hypothetical protein
MDRFKEEIDPSNISKRFGYGDIKSLLKNVYQYENLLRNTYSRALLYKLYKTFIDENVKVSEFLSEEETAILNEKSMEDLGKLLEELMRKEQK